MEIFLGIVIIILVVSLRMTVTKRLRDIEGRVQTLNMFMQRSEGAKSAPQTEQVKKESPKPFVAPATVKDVVKPAERPKTKTAPVKKEPVKEVKKVVAVKSKPKAPQKPKKSWSAWEKFIGENLMNKIGIAILVVGIGFFVKYAIDQNWIGEMGRVGIGVLAGGLLIGIAHRLRNGFRAFSSVLTGGGIATLYFTIGLGFHEYDLFTAPVAFLLMLLITAFGAVMSLAYDKVELAVIALVGGLATPLMVSTGEGNYVVLFVYLIVLNAGMLGIAYKKKWKLVNLIAFFGTAIMTAGWYIKASGDASISFNPLLALGFAFGLFLEFFGMNVLRNLKQKIGFKAFDFSMLLSNMALFYAFGMALLLKVDDGAFQGLFTVLFAAFNFGFVVFLKRKKGVDKNFLYLMIGLVMTLGSLAAPIQLEGNQITLFWAAEACLLLWLGSKSGITLIKKASIAVMGLAITSLAIDWAQLYTGSKIMTPVINKGFITGLFTVGTLILYRFFLNRSDDSFLGLERKDWVNGLSIVALGIGFVVGELEILHQLENYIPQKSFRVVWNAIYIMSYALGIKWLARKSSSQNSKLLVVPVLVGAALMFVTYFQRSFADMRSTWLVAGEGPGWMFNLHYISVGLFAVVVAGAYKILMNNKSLTSEMRLVTRAIISFLIVLVASQELSHICCQLFQNPTPEHVLLTQVGKVGFSLVWGIVASVLMTIGIKKQTRDWRLISLALFAITLVKLFVYDIQGLSEGGKIASFIGLGALLLTMSFMYQKVKGLIFTDDNKEIESDEKV